MVEKLFVFRIKSIMQFTIAIKGTEYSSRFLYSKEGNKDAA